MTARRVVVIGGGLAGISAAIRLREAGVAVTLLEARGWLGGATCSFTRGDLTIDNGQHIFLRCCTAYQDLLARLGVTGSVSMQDRFDVTVLSPHGQARLRRSNLPGLLQFAGALAGYPLLSLAERLKVGRAVLAMRMADEASPALDQIALGDWLAARWQGDHARRVLWDLFTVSSLNVAGDQASTALAATVIKTALLGGRGAADIGISAVPLGELHGSAAERLLARLGAEVRLGTKAVAIETAGRGGGFMVRTASGADGTERRLGAARGAADGTAPDGAADGALADGALADGALADGALADGALADGALADGALADGALADGALADGALAGRGLAADGIVLAVPAWVAAKLAPAELAVAAGQWPQLGISPIVNVHVIYDRRVTRLPFAAAVDSPVQWVFDKTAAAGLSRGQYLAVSLSAADGYVDVPAARLQEQFVPALSGLFPAAADATVVDCFVTRERRATFRQVPGSAALRPGAATAVPGLVLAGAWTDTGWPDTMEGAVRSGESAAQHIIGEIGGSAVAAQAQAQPAAAAPASAGAAS
ncbi:MAG: FAD-dependent oxidoreductase [Streptosporangiaceae bacterium]